MLENITNNFPLGYTQASHDYSHIFIMLSLCRRLSTNYEITYNMPTHYR